MLIASSTVLKRMTGETGPKVSCRTTVIRGLTLSSTVGEYSAPRRTLPISNWAPSATASFTTASNRRADGSSITVPMSMVGSNGSPYLTARVLSTSSSTKRSATLSCTRMRLTAVHRWPEFLYDPLAARAAASSRSASSSTMMGSFPPSSRIWRLYTALPAMYLPTDTPPVKVTRSTAGLVSSSSAISAGSPVSTESIGGGSPASYRTSASANAVSGVFSLGLSTTRLLVATAGATLWITWLSGWLNGVIAVMAPSSGSLRV